MEERSEQNQVILDKSFEVKAVFADGGCIGSNPSKKGGAVAWYAVSQGESPEYLNSFEKGGLGSKDILHSFNGFYLPCYKGLPVTNQHSEFMALLYGLEAMPENWSGYAVSDSKITLGRMFWNWKRNNLPEEYWQRFLKARARLGNIIPIHIDGHPTNAQLEAGKGKRGNPVSKWNRACDELCNEVKKDYE